MSDFQKKEFASAERAKSNTLLIHTPEGIIFPLLLAGPVTRLLAWIIDLACIIVATTFSRQALAITGLISPDFSQALTMLSYFLITIGYGIAAEWYWRGQTIGKRLLRLRVMDVQGLRLKASQVVIRNLMRFVDSLPFFYLIGGIACLFSRRAQRLGDIAANTIVIRNPKISDPDLEQIIAGKYNSLRKYPHLSARLRQKVSPREASIALQSLLRRDELDPEARVDLFKKIAFHFRTIVEFPEEAVQGITDEQYVRNVADILFTSKRS
ncbi:MAG: RDD family protein [Proteobacteria bacterium]|nr:RDD family protein [Pseudomonadota bacterium]